MKLMTSSSNGAANSSRTLPPPARRLAVAPSSGPSNPWRILLGTALFSMSLAAAPSAAVPTLAASDAAPGDH